VARRRSGSSRPSLNRAAWQKLRAMAKARDGNRCRRCGNGGKLQAHHLVRPEDGGRDELSNLVTLCSPCHRLEHKAMARKRITTSVGGRPVRENFSSRPLGVGYPSPIEGKNGSRPEDESSEDDPAAGIFWGPKQPNGMYTRWSRPWFDWRSEQSSRAECDSSPPDLEKGIS
jgi:HNH endonuclease